MSERDSLGNRASRADDERTPEPQRPREDAAGAAHQPETDGDSAPTGAADGADGALLTTLEQVRAQDLDEWQRALEAAGFSSAEAGKLIFERLRPRREGRARSS